MFGEFPVTHSFRAALFAGVYMPGRSLPAEVRFEGDLCLRFDATENANLLAISVESLSLQVVPCLLPLPESFGGSCVELRDVKITDEVVDLDASKGHLDLATGRSSMTWVLELEPARIPLMAQQGAKPFRIEFQDRGSFDARTGSYEMHHGMMEITEGPLAGALIREAPRGRSTPAALRRSLSASPWHLRVRPVSPFSKTRSGSVRAIPYCCAGRLAATWAPSTSARVDSLAWIRIPTRSSGPWMSATTSTPPRQWAATRQLQTRSRFM